MSHEKEAAKMIITFANEMINDAICLSDAEDDSQSKLLLSKVEKTSFELSELLALVKKLQG